MKKIYLQFKSSQLSKSFLGQLTFGGLTVQTLCRVNGSESFGSNTTFGGNPTVPMDVGASDVFRLRFTPSQQCFFPCPSSFIDGQTTSL